MTVPGRGRRCARRSNGATPRVFAGSFTLEAVVVRRLCEHLTTVFERAERSWSTIPSCDWLAAYEPDLDNLRAALGWSLGPDGDAALGLRFVGYTDWLWRDLSLVQEQRRWFELALTFVDDATPPSVEARIRLGLGGYFHGGGRERLAHNLRAIQLLRQAGGEQVLLGQALIQAGNSIRDGDDAKAKQYLDEALSVLRRCDRTKWLATALLVARSIRMDAGDLQAAGALVAEALALSKALGDVRLLGFGEGRLAAIEFAAGRMAEAIDRARRAVETSRRHGTLAAEFIALHWLAGLLILDDQIELGHAAALRAFELSRALGNMHLPDPIDQLPLVLAAHGETDTAARLAGFAARDADRSQFSFYAAGRAIRSRLLERLQCAMSSQECQAAMAAGAAWNKQEAVAVAPAV